MRVPRFTVRRLMIYVAALAITMAALPRLMLAIVPTVETAWRHWELCRDHALRAEKAAASYRRISARYAPDEVVTNHVVQGRTNGPLVPLSGKVASKLGPYYLALARVYHRAKWRPWEGFPYDTTRLVPWPDLR